MSVKLKEEEEEEEEDEKKNKKKHHVEITFINRVHQNKYRKN